MKCAKKYLVMIGLMLMVILGIAASAPAKKNYKNLKVLPQNISTETLSKIMVDDFTDALGVSCGFCHAEEKDSHRLDYASDEKPEKQIARLMMKMTIGINQKYFKLKHPALGSSVLEISCATCHKGQPRPDNSGE